MDQVLVRYGEIGTKSEQVKQNMLAILADRVMERLKYEDIPYTTITRIRGRICVATKTPDHAASALSELPGVQSTSPTITTDATIAAIAQKTDQIEIGESFGVKTNRSGTHLFASSDVNEAVGTHIQARTGASVDLSNPTTWVEIDIRDDTAFVFTTRYNGPGGFPVGTQAPVAALISGGIDSPVAAYQMMTRGCDITPIYCYNKPYAAGDHLVRFESALTKLVRFNPRKDWMYYKVDMEPINTTLMESVTRGRMLLHRIAMFEIAGYIATQNELHGIVTGESLGQKSSQTSANLNATTRTVDTTVFRPLLTTPKEHIVEQARALGTFDDATINSACRSIAPDHPATKMSPSDLHDLKERVGLKPLVESAIETIQRVPLSAQISATH